MRVRWTPAAVADLQHISDYLTQHHPDYRRRTMRKLYDTIRGVRESPYRGRPGSEQGTREIVFAPLPYVAVYRVRAQSVEILRVYHGAQNRP